MAEPVSDVPMMLTVRGRRCVVVGAGGVGSRRARVLAQAGAQVVIVAPQVHPSARLLSAQVHERAFEPSDLDGALLVVAATGDVEINEQVAQAAIERGVLVNRADDAAKGELAFMATHRDGPLTLGVHSGGASASAAAHLRDLLAAELDPAWGTLLALALPARGAIRKQVADPAKRAELLRRLTDDQAMQALKEGGETALQALYADIMRDLAV